MFFDRDFKSIYLIITLHVASGTSILKGAGSNTPLAARQEYGGQDYSHVVNQSFQQHNYQQKTSKYNVQEIM